MKTARNNASTLSTAMPMTRKGRRTTHKKGYATNANNASGQHTMSRMHQSSNFTISHNTQKTDVTLHGPEPNA